MQIIPSIDIKNGQCVRLKQGDFQQVSVYNQAPEKIAKNFHDAGAEILHVVDLDGAKNGKLTQIEAIRAIRANFQGIIQLGGGIRTREDCEILQKIGINRMVIGSLAIKNPNLCQAWLKEYGAEKIVLALDFNIRDNYPLVAVSGWQSATDISVWQVCADFPNIKHVLATDIGKDGMQVGPNFGFYQELLAKFPKIAIQASGGVSNYQDLKQLQAMGLSGAIIGKALHEAKITLSEAISCLN